MTATIEHKELNYQTENKTRAARQHNIALYLLRHWDAIVQQGSSLSHKALRNRLRTVLRLPALEGEAYNGDMRAHGDACFGHGLKLPEEQRIDGGHRCIALTRATFDICEKYLLQNTDQGVVSNHNGTAILV